MLCQFSCVVVLSEIWKTKSTTKLYQYFETGTSRHFKICRSESKSLMNNDAKFYVGLTNATEVQGNKTHCVKSDHFDFAFIDNSFSMRVCTRLSEWENESLREKYPYTEFFLVCFFPHSDVFTPLCFYYWLSTSNPSFPEGFQNMMKYYKTAWQQISS